MSWVAAIFLSLCLLTGPVLMVDGGRRNGTGSANESIKPRALSLFRIVRFRNFPCVGTPSKNGTCYTLKECEDKGGTNAGSCADGYGVCCTFSQNCGGSTSENCTYFESTGSEVGQCRLQVCRCSEHICQLRLDFDTFVITGPMSSTISLEKLQFGTPNMNGLSFNQGTSCLTDTFSVTNPGGIAPPVICGTNTGQHMYVDASTACNELAFQLGTGGFSSKSWSIKISQYNCNYVNLAPSGCTQYHYGSSTDTVQTYNFDGGQHLASQNQAICVRRERTNCRICWTTSIPSDFQVSGTIQTMAMGIIKQSVCCGYSLTGAGKLGYDCVQIPSAENQEGTKRVPSEICGKNVGLVTADLTTATAGNTAALMAAAKTICSTRQPFFLRFTSDQFESIINAGQIPVVGEAMNRGFRLTYIQDSTNC